jgi:hypothetical protein
MAALSDSESLHTLEDGESSQNPHRAALLDILHHGNDRFVLLVSLLIEGTLRPDINSCQCFLTGVFEKTYDDEGNCHENIRPPKEGVEAVAAVLEPIILLKIWDGSNDTAVFKGPLADPIEQPHGNAPSTHLNSNNLMSDLDAEATPSSLSPLGATSKSSKAKTKDYKQEMNEYAYGCEVSTPVASRGRGGSDDFSSHVIDDALTVTELMILDRLHDTHSKGLIESLLGVLLAAQKHSLTTLQVHSELISQLTWVRLCQWFSTTWLALHITRISLSRKTAIGNAPLASCSSLFSSEPLILTLPVIPFKLFA